MNKKYTIISVLLIEGQYSWAAPLHIMLPPSSTWMEKALCLSLLLICIGLSIVYIHTKAQKKRLTERMNFFISLVHDIRTPVTLIKASLSELGNPQILPEENSRQIKVAAKNIDKLLVIINRMLEWQKMEVQKDVLRVNCCDVDAYLKEKVADFKASAVQKGIGLQISTPADMPQVWIDKEIMDRIVENLLSNALKYTEKGSISLMATVMEKHWTLEIHDTGIGIPQEEQEHIFKGYYQANNATDVESTGTGIGLMITRRLVELHQGKIEFTSIEEKGSTFSVTFPIHPKTQRIETSPQKETRVKTNTQEIQLPTSENGKNVLLLAEDDDDMREYLEHALSSEYDIVSVSDGGKALEMAKSINPDLIISDIIMPVLQGDELCRILKSSLDTSHIPVILLTALSERENIIFGLEAGANDYIIKPFDLSVLKARLRNVIQNRQRLRSAVLSMDEPSEEMDYSSQLDKEFLDKVMEVVNGELSNPDFCINDFCRMMGMSRTSVYNKIKTLTGQGPNDFIRIMRLNKAMELIKTRRYTIGEIASLVGFSDPKYFSTCFKKQFGTSPSKI